MHYEKFADGTVKCIEDEIPFELPEGWEWCRFGNVVTLMSGTTYPAEKELLSGTRLYVKVGDMNLPGNEFEISTSSRYLDEYNISHLVPVNSVIFPKRGGAIATNKKKLVLRDEILIDLNTMAFTPISPVNLMYCYYWFLSIDLGKINSGSSVPQINNKDIEPLLFPVPPTFEQERIVQAIVPLLDAEQKISAAGIEVAQIISRAKSKILELAIRGKLVPQDPNDEPASVLLERIRAEKEELIKQGKIKRDKKESIIFRGDDNSYYEKVGNKTEKIDDQIPFDLPEGWLFVRLKELWELISGRDLSPSEYNAEGVGIPYITGASNFVCGKVELVRWTTSPQVITETGDLLLTCKGTIGEMAFNDFGNAHIARQVMAIRNTFALNSEYLALCMRFYINAIKNAAKGLIPGISREDILNLILPVPSLNYQAKVVERMVEMTNILSSIEKSLS